jgi:hypothetical protein
MIEVFRVEFTQNVLQRDFFPIFAYDYIEIKHFFNKSITEVIVIFSLNPVMQPISFIYLLFLLSSYCCFGGTLWHLPKFLQYIILEFTPSIILLYPPLPHSWNSFNMSYFSISCFHYIHPPTPFPYICPPPTGDNPRKVPVLSSCSLFLKKDILFKIAIQEFHCNIPCI